MLSDTDQESYPPQTLTEEHRHDKDHANGDGAEGVNHQMRNSTPEPEQCQQRVGQESGQANDPWQP